MTNMGKGWGMRSLPEEIAEAIEAVDLPPMPQVLLRLLQAVENELVSVSELTELVGQDVALSARIVAIANSAALRRGNGVATIGECLLVLGTRVVRSIATCLAVRRMFDDDERRESHDLSGFWRHSLLCAELSRSIAAAVGYPRPEEAYLGGLLHDVGQLVLLSALREHYGQLISGCVNESDLCETELATLGVQHGAIGAWVVDQWQLDSALSDSILFHHVTAEQILTAERLAQVVWSAHACSLGGVDAGGLQEAFGAILGAQADQLPSLHAEALRRTNMIAEAMDIPVQEAEGADGIDCTLPRVAFAALKMNDADKALNNVVGGMALMQPMQQNLFSLESDFELLLSIKEFARILFGLRRMAFLFLDQEGVKLGGAEAGGQEAIFRQLAVDINQSSCMAAVALRERAPRSSFAEEGQDRNSLIDIQFARALDSEGILCIPMLAGAKAVGVMVFGLTENQYSRLAKRLPWLNNFGRLAAVSLVAWRDAQAFGKKADDAVSDRLVRHTRRVSHEAGNPLGIIKSYLKILDSKLADDAELRGELNTLREEIDRVSAIIRRMDEIPLENQAAETEINGMIRELMGLYGTPLFTARGIKLSLGLQEGKLLAACNQDSLKQIFLNLCKNASEAMEQGGEFMVSTRDKVFLNGVPYIEILVEDTGPGLSAEAIQRLQGVGSASSADGPRGLGLSIVGALAERLGARIACRTRIGQGTAISLFLPMEQK